MKKAELKSLVNSLIPKFYSFAYGMIPDELQAQQMVVDAYAVFVVREKDFIKDYHYKEDKKEKRIMKKYILSHMLKEIYELGLKRSHQLNNLRNRDLGLSQSFYRLKAMHRGILFLKQRIGLSIEGIQEILGLKRYQVLEAIYNAEHSLQLSEKELSQGSSVFQGEEARG